MLKPILPMTALLLAVPLPTTISPSFKCSNFCGKFVPMPTRSLPPSTNNILALPLDSTLKSTSALPSLNTAPPS